MLFRFLFFIVIFLSLPATFAHGQIRSGDFTVLAGDEALTVSKELRSDWNDQRSWMIHDKTWKYTIDLSGKVASQKAISFSHNFVKVYTWLASATEKFNHEAEDAKLVITDGKVTEFNAGKDGSNVDLVDSTYHLLEALEAGYNQGNLEIVKQPSQTTLADTNTLGIKELLAVGTSTFAGSPANRRHNISIGVKNMTGLIVPPGKEFSFNEFLGPVEEEYGFLPELVIKKDGTVPELGGGLCQVSSTLFRSVMKAGLPVTQRRNHSYAVQYYAPQGTDATIYPGVIDLKFINDTAGSILIWPYLKDKNTLLFELYGTPDNRLVQLDTPVQYDRKPDGSMKAMWKRVVINNGKTNTDEFYSNYLSPALFHKEETFPKPITATEAVSTSGENKETIKTDDTEKPSNQTDTNDQTSESTKEQS